jgi:TRAP-type C4-dicarboxylate transport system permease small subunit
MDGSSRSRFGRAAGFLRMAGMVALTVMMLVTVIDITMRLSINRLVLGSVEIVQLMIVAVVFLAVPETFLHSQHITVDAIDQLVSARKRRVLRFLGSSLTLLLLVAMIWRMVPIAIDTLVIGDLTTDLQISLFWYWMPILLGTVASVASMLLVVARDFRAIDKPEASTDGAVHAE